MATTKIWAIKDSLSRVVNYASNPEKTIFSNLEQVLLYAENKIKTIDENEKNMYVTGVNCNIKTAFEEMVFTQKKYDKFNGNIAYHAYQSFKTGELSPELAHKIGVELARKMWGEHQVIVATHFNTGTYHNHFVVCSINMFTGKKFNCNKGAYYHFRELSDQICAENNLTVIKNPKGKTPRNIYFSEKKGEPTKYNLMRKAIDEAIETSITYEHFKKVMYKKGYIIDDSSRRKYPTIRSKNDKKATRLHQLGEQYTPSNIAEKVFNNPYYIQEKYFKFVKQKSKNKYKTYKYKGNFQNIRKMSGIEMLFLALFYLMGLMPKEKACYKPLSPEMKQEVRKMQRYSNQIRLIIKENLTTIDEVENYISKLKKDITNMTSIRQKYRNKLRNCTNSDLIDEYKEKRNNCTTLLKNYRDNLKIANQIIEDIPKVKETIQIEKKMKKEELNQNKEKSKNLDR